MVLYETATGALPFHGRSERELLDAIRSQEPPPPSATRPETPQALSEIIEKCLRKAPQNRFGSADALRAALDDLDGSHLPKPTFGAVPGRWRKRILALTACALAAGAGLL